MDDFLNAMGTKSKDKQLRLVHILETVLKLVELPEKELERRMTALRTAIIADYNEIEDEENGRMVGDGQGRQCTIVE